MLVIHKPEIENLNDGSAKLKAVFETGGEKKEMWYSTTREYAKYLCYERGDAFVIPLLIYAMKRNLPVKMEAPISERLYYTITNYMMKAMVYVFKEWHEVNLDCPVISEPLENAGAVGTGFSSGIDSFSTIVDHLTERQTKGYRLTHAAFFNVGAHHTGRWTDPEHTRELFRERLAHVRPCAGEIGLPIVVVDSNMEEIIEPPFASTVTFRNVSAVLALQKLFKTYYYSSDHSAYDFNFSRAWSDDYDLFILPMASTETLTIYPAGKLYTRVKKTSLVATYPISYKYLNVCMYQNVNCSKCEKCLRTLLTLDILGKLDLYKNNFDLNTYRKLKNSFIGYVFVYKNLSPFFREICDEIKRTDYKLKPKIFYYAAWNKYRITKLINRILGKSESAQVF